MVAIPVNSRANWRSDAFIATCSQLVEDKPCYPLSGILFKCIHPVLRKYGNGGFRSLDISFRVMLFDHGLNFVNPGLGDISQH